MEDYKPNSNRYKREQQEAAPEKRVERVITGPVKTKKQTGMHTFSEDVKRVGSHVFKNMLIPGAKKIMYDMFSGGLSMILFGDRGAGNPTNTIAGRVSYRNFYDPSFDTPRAQEMNRNVPAYSYDNIVFQTRTEAVEVLSRLDECLAKYKMVRVADLYDLVGVTGNGFTDNKYGWTNLASADVVPVSGGFMIRLPKALPIDN